MKNSAACGAAIKPAIFPGAAEAQTDSHPPPHFPSLFRPELDRACLLVHSRDARFKVPAASNCRRMREMEGQRGRKETRNSLIKITRPTDEAWAGGGNGMEGGLCKWVE